jgi:hypothetical protein
VWALDKLMPKVTHLLNGAQVIHAQGMNAAELRARYTDQAVELRRHAGNFPALLALHADLVARVLPHIPAAVDTAAREHDCPGQDAA